jgi:hypothetical protein
VAYFIVRLHEHAMRTVFLSIFTVLLFTSCGRDARIYELDSGSFDSKTLQRIQSDTGIVLPAGARGLNFYYKPPIDPAYIDKIEIPLKSKEDVIKTLSLIRNEDNLHTIESLGTKVRWWIPKGAKTLTDCQRLVGTGNYLHVMLTEENATVILYIEWWVI